MSDHGLGDSVIRALRAESEAQQDTVRAIGQQVIDAIAPISELPKIVNDQTLRIREGFNDSIRSRVLIAIAEQQGQVGGNESRIEEELKIIEKLRCRLEQRVEELHEKTSAELKRIDEAVHRQVEKLDGPVLALGRVVFQGALFEPLRQKISPFWDLLDKLGYKSGRLRGERFQKAATKARDSVANWQRKVESLKQRLGEYRSDAALGKAAIKVPLCVITTQVNGRIEHHVYVAPGGATMVG